MKKTLVALAALMITVASYGQGAVVFNNRVVGSVDAPITFAGGAGAGTMPGMNAQLMLVGAGGSLTPLLPVTPFRTGTAAAYFTGVDVTVPGIAPGSPATFRVQAFNGSNFATATTKGESVNFTIASLGGGTLPPANLVGLTGFNVVTVPEPATIALGVLGAAALLLRRRK